ncbi:diguanylate cyclase [Aquitalea magnusonii]|nr:diguanylate cyclase [Aquitalea magnusonii]
MHSYPIPPDEPARLQLLHALAILDTPPDEVFDRITRLVSRLLSVPIALVSLVDEDRQWFKSKVGLTAAETPRDVAFCAHAIAQTDPLIVADTQLDDRFSSNPLVTSAPDIRFYAGVQIRSCGGLALGTLCAIDTSPRTLSPEQVAILVDLAEMVSREMQLRETLQLTEAEMNHSQEIIDAAEGRFRTVFERAGVGIAMVAPDGGWIGVNDALCDIVGYTREELAHMTFQHITYADDLNADLSMLDQLVADEIDRYQLDKRYIHKSGKLVWINLTVTKQLNKQGQLDYFVSIIKDIQSRKEAENSLADLRRTLEERVKDRTKELHSANEMLASVINQQLQTEQSLRKRETELSAILENANDAYVCINQAGVVSAWNQQAEITFGWSKDEAVGNLLEELIIPPVMRERHRKGMQHYLQSKTSDVIGHRLELAAMKRDGSIIPVEVRIQALQFEDEILFSAFLHDISARKQMEILREQEARIDALTGLPNRRAFFEILPKAIVRCQRSNQALALLFIDLDGFKAVNDEQGHHAGDLLLGEIGQRLSSLLRETDTVARLAGDEFVVILENLDAKAPDSHEVAQKILSRIAQPLSLEQETVQVSASIGIALHLPDDDIDIEALLNRADKAMYDAKHAGKARIVLA